MNKLALRKMHRYLGLFAGIQLLAWTISGLYFTLIPINEIRGSHLLDKPAIEGPQINELDLIAPSMIAANHQIEGAMAKDISLVTNNGQVVWLIGDQRFDAQTGSVLSPVTEQQAREIASARSSHPIANVTEITEVVIDHEYRGGELPAWRVELQEPVNAAIYVGQFTGNIRAVRTDEWRLFDFLWSLHIMDYEEREDFNHLLIQFLAVMGLLTVMSGLVLFFVTIRRGSL